MSLDHRDMIVVDVESTCWDGDQPVDEVSEIIEIGYEIVRQTPETPDMVSRGSLLIRPDRSTISPFCTELTGHTALGVSLGMSFLDACQKLRTELHAPKFVWASWGDYDLNMFRRQCGERYVPFPFGPRHLNLKCMFSWFYGLRDGLSLGEALKYLKWDFDGRPHNGADDARNIARIARHLLTSFKGVKHVNT